MQNYVDIGPDGKFAGFYSDEIHGDAIPKSAVPITEKQWRAWQVLEINSYRFIYIDGQLAIDIINPAPLERKR